MNPIRNRQMFFRIRALKMKNRANNTPEKVFTVQVIVSLSSVAEPEKP
jgi:hypothetical protein